MKHGWSGRILQRHYKHLQTCLKVESETWMNLGIHRRTKQFFLAKLCLGSSFGWGNVHMLHVDPLNHQPRGENISDENIVSGEKI